ncbi:MAG TPA: hypothetical protein VFQ12_10820 [Thermoleophilaceae bacterium]|nr:hypothetical protein [Thermoleophilaceae bacterium]
MQLAWKLGVLAVVALLLVLLPGGGATLDVVLTLLTIAFFAAIAFLGYRLFRQYRFEIGTLGDRQRLVLYGSVAAALVTFTATNRMFDEGGLGVLAWFALLGLCSYGLYWVWMSYRRYS